MTAPFPIAPVRVTVDGFRGWSGRHSLELGSGLTLLVGPNGAGKSSLINAVEWCLFGSHVAKKSSGLEERADWEVAHRSGRGGTGGTGGVEVRVELSVGEGNATLVRRREAGAKPRDPDQVVLERPGAEPLEGEALQAWMEEQHLPDWRTWKHAFCQHQEQARGRVLDATERSVQLGKLLGLDEYREVSELLRGLKAGDLEKVAQGELERIEAEWVRSLDRPGRALRELEERLQARGVAATELGEGAFARRAGPLVASARSLAERLELDEPFPDPEAASSSELLAWAQDWVPVVRRRAQVLERERGELARELQDLAAALEGIEPAQRRRRDARSAWERWTREHGTAESLQAEGRALEEELRKLRERAREQDEQLQLLRHAAEWIERADPNGTCPVCEGEAADLLSRLKTRVAAAPGDGSEAAMEAVRARARRVEEQRGELARLESDLELATVEHGRLTRRLEARLPSGSSGATPTEAELDALRRGWQQRLAELQATLDQVDLHLESHRRETELLEWIGRWQQARARADASGGDLRSLPAWDELQGAIDEAACLASDLSALEQLARELQRERSEERVREVNRTLGQHYARIVSGAGPSPNSGVPDSGAEGVQVAVKSTATKLSYLLVDRDGANVTPVLNQAALNALSLALLFAQAEERDRREWPRWLLLDDPAQSLDDHAAAGLAEALLALSERLPVCVATFPGALGDALQKAGPERCRVVRIASDGAGASTLIEEVRT